MTRHISHIVVHYSATFEDQSFATADIRQWHKEAGMADVGYHWIIRRDGVVEKGRPEDQIGAHVRGHNEHTIGICWIGGLNRKTGPLIGVDNRTPEQTAALVKLIRDIRTRHPGAAVVGHKNLAATQCPGFDVVKWWIGVVNQSENRLPADKWEQEVAALVEKFRADFSALYKRRPAG